MKFGKFGMTIDELMRVLEECGQDQPVVIEKVAHGDITPYEFDSFFDVRSSRVYTGDVFLGIDPEIWYETQVESIWRDDDWFDGKVVITLVDVDEMEQKYDSFRVSAIFKGGTNVDNDIVEATGEKAVEAELEAAREWFREFDEEPEYFLISYYKDGDCVDTEEV